jgi:osmotically-inducible protein OsmY
MSVVYLLGVAQDQNELNRAIKAAGSIKGVRKIVNHVIMKNDPRRNAKPINQE